MNGILNARLRIDLLDRLVCEKKTADDPVALRIDLCLLDRIVADKKSTGRIACADFLAQCKFNQRADHETIDEHRIVAFQRVRRVCL